MKHAFAGAGMYLAAIVVGFLLGALYDLLRVRHIASAPPHKFGKAPTPVPLTPEALALPPRKWRAGVALFFEDVLFALTAAIVTLLFLFAANKGKPRLLVFVLLGLGFVLYRETLGRLVTRFASAVVARVHAVLRFLWRRMLKPLFVCMAYPFVRLFSWGRKKIETYRKKRYVKKQKKKEKQDENNQSTTNHRRHSRRLHRGELPPAGGCGSVHSARAGRGDKPTGKVHSHKTR